ncbi:hypothetical protein FACS189449_06010 [Alphaproteobacteria bacterium]|nr:hypothetical protein FACS189449_06010 [Alphaproteobacteria bacterium]
MKKVLYLLSVLVALSADCCDFFGDYMKHHSDSKQAALLQFLTGDTGNVKNYHFSLENEKAVVGFLDNVCDLGIEDGINNLPPSYQGAARKYYDLKYVSSSSSSSSSSISSSVSAPAASMSSTSVPMKAWADTIWDVCSDANVNTPFRNTLNAVNAQLPQVGKWRTHARIPLIHPYNFFGNNSSIANPLPIIRSVCFRPESGMCEVIKKELVRIIPSGVTPSCCLFTIQPNESLGVEVDNNLMRPHRYFSEQIADNPGLSFRVESSMKVISKDGSVAYKGKTIYACTNHANTLSPNDKKGEKSDISDLCKPKEWYLVIWYIHYQHGSNRNDIVSINLMYPSFSDFAIWPNDTFRSILNRVPPHLARELRRLLRSVI